MTGLKDKAKNLFWWNKEVAKGNERVWHNTPLFVKLSDAEAEINEIIKAELEEHKRVVAEKDVAIQTRKMKALEVLLDTFENSPFRRMECQIEQGLKNARKNWKQKKISDEDFKRIVTTMYIPLQDVRGVLLHFDAFEKDYVTDLERLRKANREKYDIIQKFDAEIQKLQKDNTQIHFLYEQAQAENDRLVGACEKLDAIRKHMASFPKSALLYIDVHAWKRKLEELVKV